MFTNKSRVELTTPSNISAIETIQIEKSSHTMIRLASGNSQVGGGRKYLPSLDIVSVPISPQKENLQIELVSHWKGIFPLVTR